MIRIIFLSIFFLYFQYFFAENLAIMTVVPNFLLSIIIFLGITNDEKVTLIFAFILGVIIDLNTPCCFGISTLLFVIIAFILGKVKGSLNKKQLGLYLFLVIVSNLFYFLLRDLIIFVFNVKQGLPIFKIVFLSFYSSLFSFIIILLFLFVSKLHISTKRF
ncbi:MAG: rod shape-determining protein MreD [Candidatus Cloacimonadota bacterium]|nr:rod shape-determining protein MreD [Candidatus Cloacimonadota bacterium]